MKPTVVQTLHFPVVAVEILRSITELREALESPADFDDLAADLARDGCAHFQPDPLAFDPKDGVWGVVLSLKDGTFPICFSFLKWACDTEQEAHQLAADLAGPGGDFEGQTVLIVARDNSPTGRA